MSNIGYINLISSYKHYFHDGKHNGKHIYSSVTDITEYYKMYEADKNLTMSIRENIFEYEKLIKTHIGDSISRKYNELDTTNAIKTQIIVDLEDVISKLSPNTDDVKLRKKVKYLEKLKLKFSESDKEYYLV